MEKKMLIISILIILLPLLLGCTVQKEIVEPLLGDELPVCPNSECRGYLNHGDCPERYLCDMSGTSAFDGGISKYCMNWVCEQVYECSSDADCVEKFERESPIGFETAWCRDSFNGATKCECPDCLSPRVDANATCVAGGGLGITTFSSGCVDNCGVKPRICTTAMTEGCDCGPTLCWDGTKCVDDEYEPYATSEEACEATGGTWSLDTMEDSTEQIANPAAVYCEKLGYSYETITEEDNSEGYPSQIQKSVCKLPKGKVCDAWEFFTGKCGQEYSYCEKIGGGKISVTTEDCKFDSSCSLCTLPDGRTCNDYTYLTTGICGFNERPPAFRCSCPDGMSFSSLGCGELSVNLMSLIVILGG